MSRVVIVTRHTPLPWDDGAGAYLFDLVEHLSSHGYQVHLLWLQPHDSLRWQGIWKPNLRIRMACRLHMPGSIKIGPFYIFPNTFWLPFKARTLNRFKQFLQFLGLWNSVRVKPPLDSGNRSANSGLTLNWMSTPSGAEEVKVAAVLKRIRPVAMIVNYSWLCPLFELDAVGELKKICVNVDVGWRRGEILALQSEMFIPELTAAQEASWLRKADAIVAISEADASEFRAMAPSLPVWYSPKAFHLTESQSRVGLFEPHSCLFVGSANSLNHEALDWFLTQVWPGILVVYPGARLVVAGNIDQCFTLRPPQVTFVGRVENLDSLYQSAQIVIVPLLHATGMNIKLVEAASRGCACVVTPTALRTVPFLEGAVAEAGNATEFISAMLRLLGDSNTCIQMGKRCRDITLEHLSLDRSFGPVTDWLRSCVV
jgi:succinoglycan biosynthesis protein ExoO